MTQTKFLIGYSLGEKVYFNYLDYTMTCPSINSLSVVTLESDPRETAQRFYKGFVATKESKAELYAKRDKIAFAQHREYRTRGNTERSQKLFSMLEEISEKIEEV